MGVIANKLSEMLGRKRMSVKALQRATGVSYGALHALYANKTKRVDLSILARICGALDCEVGDILEYVPGEGSQDE